MNRISTNILATLIVILVVFFLGRLMLLAGLQTEIQQAQNRLEQTSQTLAELNAEAEKVRVPALADKLPKSSKMLKPGEESTLLRLLGSTAGKSFRLNSFDVIESFRIKPENSDESAMSSSGFGGGSEELPQLDEQGMPVGISTEENEEWPGVEVVPVKMTFSTTYRTIGKFLSEAGRNLPVNAVRSMDMMIRDGGLVRGTLVMTFPLTETNKR